MAHGRRGRPSVEPIPWAVLVFLMAAMFTGVTAEFLPTGLLLPMSRDLGTSQAETGLLVTTYSLVVALTSVPLVRGTWRFRTEKLLAAALGGYALGNALLVSTDVYLVAVLARLVSALAHSLFFGLVAGYVTRLVPTDRTGRAIATVWLGTSLAFLAGVPLGTLLGTVVGWRVPFAVLVVLGTFTALVALRWLPRVPATAVAATSASRQSHRALLIVAVTTSTAMAAQFTLYTYLSPFLTDRGLAERLVGPALLVYGATGMVGTLLAGLLVDRSPRGGLLSVLGVLAAAVLALSWTGSVGPVAIVALASWGLTFGALSTFLNTAAVRAAPSVPDLAAATATTSFNVGIGSGALLGAGLLATWGTAVLAPVAALLATAAWVLVAAARRGAFPP